MTSHNIQVELCYTICSFEIFRGVLRGRPYARPPPLEVKNCTDITVADLEFARGRTIASREPKRGSGVGAPSGVQGQNPWWRVRGVKPHEAESFLSIFIQKVAKS